MNHRPSQPAAEPMTITVSAKLYAMLTGIATVLRCTRVEVIEDLVTDKYEQITGRQAP